MSACCPPDAQLKPAECNDERRADLRMPTGRLRRSRSTRSCRPRWRVRAEQTGVRRASMDVLTLFVLSVLAGAFISFGAIFATTVTAGSISIGPAGDGAAMTAALPYGIARLLTGLVFSVGLILVVVGGAELFTGNTLLVMAWASRKVTTRAVLLNWLVAFIGNCIGTDRDRGADVPDRPSIPSATARSDWWR